MEAVVAVLLALAALTTTIALEQDAKTVGLYSAPFSSIDYLVGEKGGIDAVFNKCVVAAFRNKDEISAFVVPKGIKSIYDPANGYLQPLREFINSAVPKAALTLSAARFLALPEMSLPVHHIHMPATDLETTFHQAEEAHPYVLFVAKDVIRGGNRLSIENLHRLGDFSFEQGSVEIVHDFAPTRRAGDLEPSKTAEN
ncbi:uncharacterized protein LOC117651028 [Thrips palmi]|uniref:Uncharacterized protein LOC117651028 n=1 Tax=Thrips palmi TaxID=161013 RepID=A0A6P8ZZV3_THRPL|nr:uncharacterized protein LOC117651028 [Thrips palmi]